MKTLAAQIAEARAASAKALANAEKTHRVSRAIMDKIDAALAAKMLGTAQAEKLKADVRTRGKSAAKEAEAAANRLASLAAEGRELASRNRYFREARFAPAAPRPSDHSPAEEKLLFTMSELLEEQRRTRIGAELARATPAELQAYAREAAGTQNAALAHALRQEHNRRWQGRLYGGGELGSGAQLTVGAAVTSAEEAINLPESLTRVAVDVDALERDAQRLNTLASALAYNSPRAHKQADDAELGDAITETETPADAVARLRDRWKVAEDLAADVVNGAAVEEFKKMLEDDPEPEEPAAVEAPAPDAA